MTGVVGTSRNARMSVTVASATATFTADELIVQTALGGRQYKLSSFNKSVNLAITGAGGMDTGAVPVAGFVALYAIYNPTTQASALLAVNATSVAAPEICTGVMPAGYTASALVSVWGILASKFITGNQIKRLVSFSYVQVFNGSTSTAGTPTVQSLSIAGVVPLNTAAVSGTLVVHSNAASVNVVALAVAGDSNMSGYQQSNLGGSSSGGMDASANFNITLAGPNVLYYTLQTSTATTVSGRIYISSYEF
ncbi:phage tail protein [Yersinia frederiksenii]|uniref:phage tail protein n=1 Tax=Yersinia frederiksenii TaxID=29484 RepID=UPI00164396C9|nr:phage tail protein [Yersinia frederiksenii]